MEKSDRDIGQWDARLKEQLERKFHNYHKRRINLNIARDNVKFNWTGEKIIVESASNDGAIATVRILFDDADPLTLKDNVEIDSIFNRVFITNEIQPGDWLDVIYGINFEYKKKISGGLYVDRGDPSSYDFTVGDFTTDGAWHTLDLSGITPVGARLVHIHVNMTTAGSSRHLWIREKGNVNTSNRLYLNQQVANVNMPAEGWVMQNANCEIEYHTTNVVFTALSLLVRGWFA